MWVRGLLRWLSGKSLPATAGYARTKLMEVMEFQLSCFKLLKNDAVKVLHSVQFSHSVVPNSLRPHEPQHTRPPRPSPAPGVHPNPCPLSRWCHPTISSSVVPFSSCPQSFPASGSFQMSQYFPSGGQSIGVSASALVLPMSIQDWYALGMDWWDLLAVQGTLKRLLQHHSSKASILRCLAFFIVQLSHPYMTICQQIWKTQHWPQDWKRSVFIPIPKGNAKECSNYCTITLVSQASKVMLKILQARLQQCVNHELPGVQARFRKGRGTRDQIANIR